jgi:hypothetical protein
LETFPVNGQITSGPAVHFAGAEFKNVEQPAGKSSLRVLTDDGRVGTTEVTVPPGGKLEATIQVNAACTAVGRVVNGKAQPSAGAHLVAQQLGSRISQSTEAGPRGGFQFRALTKGDYQLTIEIGTAHVIRRFSIGSSCAANLGTLMLLDAPASAKPAN